MNDRSSRSVSTDSSRREPELSRLSPRPRSAPPSRHNRRPSEHDDETEPQNTTSDSHRPRSRSSRPLRRCDGSCQHKRDTSRHCACCSERENSSREEGTPQTDRSMTAYTPEVPTTPQSLKARRSLVRRPRKEPSLYKAAIVNSALRAHFSSRSRTSSIASESESELSSSRSVSPNPKDSQRNALNTESETSDSEPLDHHHDDGPLSRDAIMRDLNECFTGRDAQQRETMEQRSDNEADSRHHGQHSHQTDRHHYTPSYQLALPRVMNMPDLIGPDLAANLMTELTSHLKARVERIRQREQELAELTAAANQQREEELAQQAEQDALPDPSETVLVTHPREHIVVNSPFNQTHAYRIRLDNPSPYRVSYCWKATGGGRLLVNPRHGILEPRQQLTATFVCNPFTPSARALEQGDTLSVLWNVVSDDTTEFCLDDIFKPETKRHNLRVLYNL